MEKRIEPVTDEDVKKFYEENKDQLYRSLPVPEEPSRESSSEDVRSKDKEGASKDKKTAPKKSETVGGPAEKKTPEEKKALNNKSESDAKGPSEPKKPTSKPAGAKPAEGEAKAKGKANANQAKTGKPAAEAKSASKTGRPGAADQPKASAQFAVPPEKPKTPAAAKTTTQRAGKPASKAAKKEPKKVDSNKRGGSQQSAKRKPEAETQAAKAARKIDEHKSSQPTTTSKPKSTDTQSASEKNAKTPPAKAKPEPKEKRSGQTQPAESRPKYRPLDEELKAEIRERLKDERIRAALQKAIEHALEKMRELGYRHSAPKGDPEHLTADQIAAELKAYAKKNGLHYAETPLLSAKELEESEDYPIGQAIPPTENPFERQGAPTVTQRVFGQETLQLFMPDVAEDIVTNSRFAYWATKDVPEHVPTFDEPGVREQVVRAWKLQQARPKAEARAKQLAERARKALAGETDEAAAKKTLANVLNDETVTGVSKGPALNVVSTPQFSWLTMTSPSVPPLNPFQPPPTPTVQLTDLSPLVTKAGEQFMRTVFNKLQPGEVGVAPNADKTVYYVVYLKERIPSTPEAEAAMREQFLKENPFASQPFQQLTRRERSEVYLKWLEEFQRKYEVRWNKQEEAETARQP
ncbi:MAG: hypothetical protein GXP27_21505 [Planctomycetes bacterium]|nr:hypothetical protein [Planctomycetota bacterium]